MDKEDVAYIHIRIWLSHKKEWNSATCDNMNGPWRYYTKWNKSNMISILCETQKTKTNEQTK